MNVNKLVPWNWFKDERENGSLLPARRDTSALASSYPLDMMRREMDRMFDEVLRGFGTPSFGSLLSAAPWNTEAGWLKPNLDIDTSEKEYKVHVELPGVDEKDVHLELIGETLRIRGEKKEHKEDKQRQYIERRYGSFERVLTLPEDAQQDGIAATFKNGVMTIAIPRQAVAQTPARQIEVKAA